MAPLPGFSDNPFNTRSDLIRAALALIRPLHQYKSSQKARIKLATSTGAGFSETAAQLEGFARPLWVVADLLRLQSTTPDIFPESHDVHLETWIEGLKAGTDPSSPEYWGDLHGFDQRMVEMESIAYALLSNPTAFSFPSSPTTRSDLTTWLLQINAQPLPQTNWLWFRVLVNLALVKTLAVPLDQVKHHINAALAKLDTFYLQDGWSSDGAWCDERKQADYYSGSFAIQFAQLLFVRFAADYDTQRTLRYKQQAAAFAQQYWRFFAPNGAAIPFGRSLTYRFAMSAFWSAAAVAGVELPAPVSQVGSVKGLLLRNLRWWAGKGDVFNVDGTLSLGYTYPNMNMTEDYNSPQSVYWCLKALVVLGLDEEDGFWMAEELPYPIVADPTLPHSQHLPSPSQTLLTTPYHTSLLSSGQSTTKHFRAREAKYGKFAYSSAFAFSVPAGPFLEQIAPDSTLAVTLLDAAGGQDEGEWKVRWDPFDVVAREVVFGGDVVSVLGSKWRPWRKRGVVVRTVLGGVMKRWAGWSLRLHCLEWGGGSAEAEDGTVLRVVDGGFCVSAGTRGGGLIGKEVVEKDFQPAVREGIEGCWNDGQGVLVVGEQGASGVYDLTAEFTSDDVVDTGLVTQSIAIKADPNTNLTAQRGLIPAIDHRLHRIESTVGSTMKAVIVTGVFAVDAAAGVNASGLWKIWSDRPKGHVSIHEESGDVVLKDA
ncbi:hypothetical protein T440DRAFT_479291 [Plenodomus tracheiphilus IPT5]|uniref:Uncharacterized protein n=1 Tax=Plenodomus tracheiphilus IPT5 TaxID=1408161 RepID=A0A6A7B899_9PLEO|nr:hypothetical protein T440DRAFT_479291 [Plenodomus tracheiphilus IPT5]